MLCVWAPNAQRVSVVGDFNHWDGRIFPMEKHEDSGIFELFIPEMKAGTAYKYEIKFKGGNIAVRQTRTADSATPVRALHRLCMQIFRLHGKMVHGRRRKKTGI